MLQGNLTFPAFGDVTGNFRKSDKGSMSVTDRIDDHAGPEPRAVLPHAQAFGFELTFSGSSFQRPGRAARRPVFFRVEDAEVLSDDFTFAVPLDPFGSRIPVGDDPVLVQHKDCEVCHALDEYSEPPFGAKPVFCLVL